MVGKVVSKLAALGFLFITGGAGFILYYLNTVEGKLSDFKMILWNHFWNLFWNLFFPRWAGEHINHMRRANDLSFQGHVVRSKLKKVL